MGTLEVYMTAQVTVVKCMTQGVLPTFWEETLQIFLWLPSGSWVFHEHRKLFQAVKRSFETFSIKIVSVQKSTWL